MMFSTRRRFCQALGLGLGSAMASPVWAATSAQRVVTLTSLSGDLIQRLDPKKLVGISSDRLLGKDPRFVNIPSVGTGRGPNLEKIVALKPDLVVAATGIQEPLIRQLQQLKISVLETRVDNWSALAETTRRLAQAIGADPQPLLDRYATLLPASAPPRRPKTLLLAGIQPMLAPSRKSWAGDLLERMGADSVSAQLEGQSPFRGYVTLSAEKVLQANPEVLLIVNPEAQGDPLAPYRSQPFWSKLAAVQKGRVYACEYYGLVNPGSLDKIIAACNQLKESLS